MRGKIFKKVVSLVAAAAMVMQVGLVLPLTAGAAMNSAGDSTQGTAPVGMITFDNLATGATTQEINGVTETSKFVTDSASTAISNFGFQARGTLAVSGEIAEDTETTGNKYGVFQINLTAASKFDFYNAGGLVYGLARNWIQGSKMVGVTEIAEARLKFASGANMELEFCNANNNNVRDRTAVIVLAYKDGKLTPTVSGSTGALTAFDAPADTWLNISVVTTIKSATEKVVTIQVGDAIQGVTATADTTGNGSANLGTIRFLPKQLNNNMTVSIDQIGIYRYGASATENVLSLTADKETVSKQSNERAEIAFTPKLLHNATDKIDVTQAADITYSAKIGEETAAGVTFDGNVMTIGTDFPAGENTAVVVTATDKNGASTTKTITVTNTQVAGTFWDVTVNHKSGEDVIYVPDTEHEGQYIAKTALVEQAKEGDAATYTVPDTDKTFDGYLKTGDNTYQKYQFTYDESSINTTTSAEGAEINLNYTKKAYKTVTIKYVDAADGTTELKEARTIADQLEGTTVAAEATDKATIEKKEGNVPIAQYVYDASSTDNVTVTAYGTDDVITLKFNGTAYVTVAVTNTVEGIADPIKSYTDYALVGSTYQATAAQLGYKKVNDKYYFPKADAAKSLTVAASDNTLAIAFEETDKTIIDYEDFENDVATATEQIWGFTAKRLSSTNNVEHKDGVLKLLQANHNDATTSKSYDTAIDNKKIAVSFRYRSDIGSGSGNSETDRLGSFELSDSSGNVIFAIAARGNKGNTGGVKWKTTTFADKDEGTLVTGTAFSPNQCKWCDVNLVIDLTGETATVSGTITPEGVAATTIETQTTTATDFKTLTAKRVNSLAPQWIDMFSIEDITPDPTYTVSGTAGAGVASVTLTKTGETTGTTIAAANFGEGGAFTFEDVAAGEYTISAAAAEGYTLNTIENATFTITNENKTGIAVTATENTYTVSGTAGAGVASVTLTKTGETTGTTIAAANFGEGGAFTFEGVKAGEYTISATAAAGYTVGTIADATFTITNANKTGIAITATENTYTVSGTVDANVTSVTLSDTADVSHTYRGTLEGTAVTFTNVSAGTYTISATYANEYEADTITVGGTAATTVTVTTEDVTTLAVTSKQTVYTIRVTKDAGITSVKLVNKAEASMEYASEADGENTVIKNVPAGEYTVAVTYASAEDIAADGAITEYTVAKSTAKTLTVASKKKTYTVTGTVDNTDAVLEVQFKQGEEVKATVAKTDIDATAKTFSATLPAGEYTVAVRYATGYRAHSTQTSTASINIAGGEAAVPTVEVYSEVLPDPVVRVTGKADDGVKKVSLKEKDNADATPIEGAITGTGSERVVTIPNVPQNKTYTLIVEYNAEYEKNTIDHEEIVVAGANLTDAFTITTTKKVYAVSGTATADQITKIEFKQGEDVKATVLPADITEGAFSVNLPAGEYTVAVTPEDGYVVSDTSASTVTVAAAGNTPATVAVVTELKKYTVSGTGDDHVTAVKLTNKEDNTFYSGVGGRAIRLPDIKPGEYTIEASFAEGYELDTIKVDGVETTELTVTNADITTLEITSKATQVTPPEPEKYTVSGTASLNVTKVTLSQNGEEKYSAVPAQGAFSIEEVEAGEYTVGATFASGYELDEITVGGVALTDNKLTVSAAVTDLSVTEKDTVNPVIKYPIRGTATADEIVKIEFKQNGEVKATVLAADINSDGEFSVEVDAVGAYDVVVTPATGYKVSEGSATTVTVTETGNTPETVVVMTEVNEQPPVSEDVFDITLTAGTPVSIKALKANNGGKAFLVDYENNLPKVLKAITLPKVAEEVVTEANVTVTAGMRLFVWDDAMVPYYDSVIVPVLPDEPEPID